MPQVNLYDGKTHLSRLVDRAAAGEEIVIARSGKPVARLVPLAESWLEPAAREVGFGVIPVSLRDAARVRALPWHHRNPSTGCWSPGRSAGSRCAPTTSG